MAQDFVPLAERIIDALLASDPRLAGYAGDHRFDDRLPDLSADAVARDVAMLHDASGALSQVDDDTLTPQERVDHAVLFALVERALFEHNEVREHEWNPLAHNPGPLLYRLVARPFAPPAQRLESLAARLAAIPDALTTARGVLANCPRIHIETAIGQFAGTATLVRGQVPILLAEAPALKGLVEPAAAAAVAALNEFGGWLSDQLATGDPGRDPRLGRRLWEARLWHALDTELTAAEVLSRACARLDQTSAQLREAAAGLVDRHERRERRDHHERRDHRDHHDRRGRSGGGWPDDETVRAALDRLAEDRPDDASIVDLARLALAETTDFVTAHELVSTVDDPCVVLEMPEFARGVAVAYCDSPGPLETAEVPTFYCIAPTPADWTPERVTSFYREYNSYMVRELTIHEAMPGHYLQRAHDRRYRAPTRARALGYSGPFVEGWAVYAEEVMAEYGFGGVPVRLQQLKMQLRMAINAILDQLVHCEGMAEAEAMELMTRRGFQEEGEAAGKWRRALLTSTQMSTYFVGYTEVAQIAAARPAGTSVRAWHDEMLAYGSPAPRHLRTLLGV